MDNFVWQCKCSHIEHGEMPEDCEKCLAVNTFKRVPEDQIEEAMEGAVLSVQPEDGEDGSEDSGEGFE